jgi:hypothetical protein
LTIIGHRDRSTYLNLLHLVDLYNLDDTIISMKLMRQSGAISCRWNYLIVIKEIVSYSLINSRESWISTNSNQIIIQVTNRQSINPILRSHQGNSDSKKWVMIVWTFGLLEPDCPWEIMVPWVDDWIHSYSIIIIE